MTEPEKCQDCGLLYRDDESCPLCRGLGMLKESLFSDPSKKQNRTCRHCRGTGKSHSCIDRLKVEAKRLRDFRYTILALADKFGVANNWAPLSGESRQVLKTFADQVREAALAAGEPTAPSEEITL